MEIYLPVAEMSVYWLVMIGLGLGVGFLSGMFGVWLARKTLRRRERMNARGEVLA